MRVLFVDYGSSEWLPSSRIVAMPTRFAAVPPYAVCCRLSGLDPPNPPPPPAIETARNGLANEDDLCEYEGVGGGSGGGGGRVGGAWPPEAVAVMQELEGQLVLAVVDSIYPVGSIARSALRFIGSGSEIPPIRMKIPP